MLDTLLYKAVFQAIKSQFINVKRYLFSYRENGRLLPSPDLEDKSSRRGGGTTTTVQHHQNDFARASITKSLSRKNLLVLHKPDI